MISFERSHTLTRTIRNSLERGAGNIRRRALVLEVKLAEVERLREIVGLCNMSMESYHEMKLKFMMMP